MSRCARSAWTRRSEEVSAKFSISISITITSSGYAVPGNDQCSIFQRPEVYLDRKDISKLMQTDVAVGQQRMIGCSKVAAIDGVCVIANSGSPVCVCGGGGGGHQVCQEGNCGTAPAPLEALPAGNHAHRLPNKLHCQLHRHHSHLPGPASTNAVAKHGSDVRMIANTSRIPQTLGCPVLNVQHAVR